MRPSLPTPRRRPCRHARPTGPASPPIDRRGDLWILATQTLLVVLGLVLASVVHAQASGVPQKPAQVPAVPAPGVQPSAADDAEAELAFIERLYREQDDYRAETEALRFLHYRPHDPHRPAVELARAKLYYREGRYGEANLMLYSLLDRHPQGDTAEDARRLLTFSQLRLGQIGRAAETADALALPGHPPPSLAALGAPPPGTVDGDAAVTWSTWLPGSGFAKLGEPGKAAAGISLNLTLIGAAVLSAQDNNAPAALLFLVLESMLWQGGRSGVRQEATAINRRLREQRLNDWIADHGESQLLGVGIALRFGGP